MLWRAKAVRIRFGTDFHEHVTPFVGRELEKPLLIGIYERAMQRRSTQLVTIVGEPGVGKSRLVAELFAYMHAKPEIIRWRQGRCLPYGEGITFWALGEIVKREAAILESDSAEVALQKLDAALAPDEPERQWLIQRLAPLVGAEAGAPAERQEAFTAWRRYLEGIASTRETVLVFEDLHWADDALLSFLEHLAEWADDVPLLIICNARPELYERRPGWGAGQRNAHTINLSPLSDEETAELVSSLIAVGVLTRELQQAILERAGGNPLYAEEFVRLLADRGLSAEELTLPESVQALIAARLDTLAPERKSLLQDAAVMGKVFWTSAVSEMGGLDQRDVELALHELARKELVRAARTSSMEGESEYSFWHLLVRDVAYSQIPRAQRARRHRAAAEWIERKAGERVEDLAEVLAHHYLKALELAEAAGDSAQAEQLRTPARRFVALAGERALGLDTAQAEARLARALELTAEEDPQRLTLVTRWADAALQAGRMREAVAVLDEALASLRSRAGTEAIAEALQLRSRVSTRLAEGRGVELAAEAVQLLEREERRPQLVDAYSQLANAHWISGSYAAAVDAADRACALAQELGLPDPPRALGYRGMARAYAGDAGGLAEMERALAAFLEIGTGREVAVIQNNLAVAGYPLEGPERSLAAFDAAVDFCQQRGLVEAERLLVANRPGLLAELGRTGEALEDAAALAVVLEASGQMADLVEVRAVELSVRIGRGDRQAHMSADWLLEASREVRHVDISTYGRVAVGLALADDAPDEARAVLREVGETLGSARSPYYARHLGAMVRTALTVGDPELARRLVEKLEPKYPLDERALCAARAQLAEHTGELDEAVGTVCGSGVGVAEVRQRAGERVRASRTRPLPSRTGTRRCGGAAAGGARALRIDGIQARAGGGRDPPRAAGHRAELLALVAPAEPRSRESSRSSDIGLTQTEDASVHRGFRATSDHDLPVIYPRGQPRTAAARSPGSMSRGTPAQRSAAWGPSLERVEGAALRGAQSMHRAAVVRLLAAAHDRRTRHPAQRRCSGPAGTNQPAGSVATFPRADARAREMGARTTATRIVGHGALRSDRARQTGGNNVPAASALAGSPVTVVRTSRSRTRRRRSLAARTLAVRGTSRRRAISPKKSAFSSVRSASNRLDHRLRVGDT